VGLASRRPRRPGGSQPRAARMLGLGTADNPVFPCMHEASALVAGASLAGGMHHAMAAHASGFGVYNDVAIAIAWLLGHGVERIAYVDIDAHHGDGPRSDSGWPGAGRPPGRTPAVPAPVPDPGAEVRGQQRAYAQVVEEVSVYRDAVKPEQVRQRPGQRQLTGGGGRGIGLAGPTRCELYGCGRCRRSALPLGSTGMPGMCRGRPGCGS
jgi:hypothetical protein